MVMWQGQLIAAKQAGAGRASSLEEVPENSRIEVAQPKQKLAISTVPVLTARDPERLLRQVGLQLSSSHIRSHAGASQKLRCKQAWAFASCKLSLVFTCACTDAA